MDSFVVGKIANCAIAPFDSPKRTAYVFFDTSSGTNLGAGLCEIPVGSSNNRHQHEDHDEVIYVLSGKIEFRFPNESVVLEKPDCIYIPKGLDHQIFNVGEETAWHTFTFNGTAPVDMIKRLYQAND